MPWLLSALNKCCSFFYIFYQYAACQIKSMSYVFFVNPFFKIKFLRQWPEMHIWTKFSLNSQIWFGRKSTSIHMTLMLHCFCIHSFISSDFPIKHNINSNIPDEEFRCERANSKELWKSVFWLALVAISRGNGLEWNSLSLVSVRGELCLLVQRLPCVPSSDQFPTSLEHSWPLARYTH